jgi:uncharacterized protein (TIGR02145 family)
MRKTKIGLVVPLIWLITGCVDSNGASKPKPGDSLSEKSSIFSEESSFSSQMEILPSSPVESSQIKVSSSSETQKRDSLIDLRDGRVYPVVEIGRQKWLAKNLDYLSERQSWFYQSDETVNRDLYGIFYPFTSLNGQEFEVDSGDVSTDICPSGWHVPSLEEWEELFNFVGSDTAVEKLKSSEKWLGKTAADPYGFAALPAGDFFPPRGSFRQIGGEAGFWTSTLFHEGFAYSIAFAYDSGEPIISKVTPVETAMNVRCVLD